MERGPQGSAQRGQTDPTDRQGSPRKVDALGAGSRVHEVQPRHGFRQEGPRGV